MKICGGGGEELVELDSSIVDLDPDPPGSTLFLAVLDPVPYRIRNAVPDSGALTFTKINK
jgi:hypothetical protein